MLAYSCILPHVASRHYTPEHTFQSSIQWFYIFNYLLLFLYDVIIVCLCMCHCAFASEMFKNIFTYLLIIGLLDCLTSNYSCLAAFPEAWRSELYDVNAFITTCRENCSETCAQQCDQSEWSTTTWADLTAFSLKSHCLLWTFRHQSFWTIDLV